MIKDSYKKLIEVYKSTYTVKEIVANSLYITI